MKHTNHTLLGYLRSGRPIYSNGMGGEGGIETHPALLAGLSETICDGVGGYQGIEENRSEVLKIASRVYAGFTAEDHEAMAEAFEGWLERDSERSVAENDSPHDSWNDYNCARNFHAMAAHYLGGRQIKEGGDHF